MLIFTHKSKGNTMAKRKKARRGNEITGAKTVAGAYRRMKAGKEPKNQLEREMKYAIRQKGKGVHMGKRAGLTGSSNAAIDRKMKAKAPGYRISKNGTLYYENRKNRAD